MKFAGLLLIPLLIMLVGGCGGSSAVDQNSLDDGTGGTLQQPQDGEGPRIISFTGLTSGSTIAGVRNLHAQANDNSGMAKLELLINNESVATSTVPTLDYQLDTTRFEPGPYVVTLCATDVSGNRTEDTVLVTFREYAGDDVVIFPDASDATVGTQPLNDGVSVQLPPISVSDVLEPGPPPQLILSGIRDGGTASGQQHFSAVGFSRTGVNAMALFIGGEQLLTVAGPGLDYTWDTTGYDERQYSVMFVLRDNAGQLSQVLATVTVDNTNDHQAPVFDLSRSYWQDGDLQDNLDNPYGRVYFGAGEVTMVAEAVDQSDLEWFRVLRYGNVVAETTDKVIELNINSVTDGEGGYITLDACDVLGHRYVERYEFEIAFRCTIRVLLFVEDEPLWGASVYLLNGAFETPEECDPDTAVESFTVGDYGDLCTWNFEVNHGTYTVYVTHNGEHACRVLRPAVRQIVMPWESFDLEPMP
ncbi:hypothetical protein JW859_09410 [bacterium]|nr:hypothetical protein [bacterium]